MTTTTIPESKREMTMAEALRDAMRLAMQTDPNVFLLGEDIGVQGGFGGGWAPGTQDTATRPGEIVVEMEEGADDPSPPSD